MAKGETNTQLFFIRNIEVGVRFKQTSKSYRLQTQLPFLFSSKSIKFQEPTKYIHLCGCKCLGSKLPSRNASAYFSRLVWAASRPYKYINLWLCTFMGSLPPIKQGINIYLYTVLGGKLPRTIEKAMLMYLWLCQASYISTGTSAYMCSMFKATSSPANREIYADVPVAMPSTIYFSVSTFSGQLAYPKI